MSHESGGGGHGGGEDLAQAAVALAEEASEGIARGMEETLTVVFVPGLLGILFSFL
jgi:hypothetical protein